MDQANHPIPSGIGFRGKTVEACRCAATVIAGLPESFIRVSSSQRAPPAGGFPLLEEGIFYLKIMVTSVESRIDTALFSAEKSALMYQKLRLIDPVKADDVAIAVIAKDFLSQTWEITNTKIPYHYFYHIKRDGDQLRLIHESDLYLEKDILEGINDYRRGRERLAAINYRKAMLEAEVGQSVVWVSPKRETGEVNCYYPDTFIQIAEKISKDRVWVKQFKSQDLSTSQSALLLNQLAEYQVVDPEALLDDVIIAVGLRSGRVEDMEMFELMERVAGKSQPGLGEGGIIFKQAQQNSYFKAGQFLRAVNGGLRGQALEVYYTHLLLWELMASRLNDSSEGSFPLMAVSRQIQTSCGGIAIPGLLAAGGRYFGPSRSLVPMFSSECSQCGSDQEVGSCRVCKRCEQKAA